MKNWEEFNESLPKYNPYSGNEQNVKKCPECGETEDLELLVTKDYKKR